MHEQEETARFLTGCEHLNLQSIATQATQERLSTSVVDPHLFHADKTNPTAGRLHCPSQRLVFPVRPLHAQLIPFAPGRVIFPTELGLKRL